MKHKANSMVVNTSKPNEVWYVEYRASNHITSHEEWFSYLEKPEQPGVVEIGDTPHTIEHVRDVRLSHVGQKGKLMNVLHVPTITKNLVCRSDKSSTWGCKFDSRISGAPSKTRAKSLRKGTEKGGRSSSRLTKSEP